MPLSPSLKTEFLKSFDDVSAPYFLQTVVAFANGNGGDIFIDITGVKDLSACQHTIVERLNLCSPAIDFDLQKNKQKGRVLLIISIFAGAEPPYCIKHSQDSDGIFIRRGPCTIPADEIARKELLFRGARRSFDRTVPAAAAPVTQERLKALCAKISKEAAQNARFKKYRPLSEPLTPEHLLTWGLLVEQRGELYPTFGFQLLEGTCRTVPGAAIQCAVFEDDLKTFATADQIFAGSLFDQFNAAYEWVIQHLHTLKTENEDEDAVCEIPPAAVRELLINALCHRSYLESDELITIAIYPNRLEITSPGTLPTNYSLEKMTDGRTYYRNPAIAQALTHGCLMAHWQTGLPLVRKTTAVWGLEEPVWQETSAAVKVILQRPKSLALSEAKLADILSFNEKTDIGTAGSTVIDTGSERGNRLLQLLSAHPAVTIPELMAGMELTEGQVKFELKKLKIAGFLTRQGTKKGRWLVKNP